MKGCQGSAGSKADTSSPPAEWVTHIQLSSSGHKAVSRLTGCRSDVRKKGGPMFSETSLVSLGQSYVSLLIDIGR